ncbi:MAG: zf-HC2 domain-containing protein, partial [Planctomycetota bacterium]|nr:zf-HC2 domain-containing protein [Planctomycetota bacterium]
MGAVMNGCEAIRENLCEWLDHELPAELRAGVDAHLRQCEACRAELELLRAASGAVHALPALKAPASLLPKIREEIKKEAAASADAPTPAIRAGEAFQRKAARPWTRGLVSLAAFLAMGVLVYTAITPHVPSTVTSSDQSSPVKDKKEEKALAANLEAAGKEHAQDLEGDGKPGRSGQDAQDRLAGKRAVAPAEPAAAADPGEPMAEPKAEPKAEPLAERAAQPAARPAPDQFSNEDRKLGAGRDADRPADGVERANGREQEAWKAQGAEEINRRNRGDSGPEDLKKAAAPAKEAQPFASVPKGDDAELKDRSGTEARRKELEEAPLRMKNETGPAPAPAAPPAADAPKPSAKSEARTAPGGGWNQPTPAETKAPAKPNAPEPPKDAPENAQETPEELARKFTRDEGARTGDLAKLQEADKQLDKPNANALAEEKARESGGQSREVLTIKKSETDAEPAR